MSDYRIPSIAEIAATEPNGYKVASTFAGGGGSSTGYRMAGFRVAYANEFVDAALQTYAANARPETILDSSDIREVDAADLLNELGIDRFELDLLDGSPPCSPFSTAGKREAGWGREVKYSDRVQRVDDLFFEYARLVRDLQPKVFVAENVSGLVRGSAIGYFKRIHAALRESGYRVAARVVDAQWLGVPQVRKRLILVGVREDLGIDPVHPKPLAERIPLSAALDLAATVDEIPDDLDVDPESGADISIARFAIGKEARKLSPGESSDRYFNLVRPRLDEPIPTVTATGGSIGAASVIHPNGRRKLTLREARAACGFPLDYDLRGDHQQRYERLGRSVPPLMMARLAATVRDEILGKIR